MARHSEYTRKSFTLRGELADKVRIFVGLSEDRSHQIFLELRQDFEHFLKLHTPGYDGTSSHEIDKQSHRLRNWMEWVPRSRELIVGEHWYDLSTGSGIIGPTPRYEMLAPAFVNTNRSEISGWVPIFEKLRDLAQKEKHFQEKGEHVIFSVSQSAHSQMVILSIRMGEIVGV